MEFDYYGRRLRGYDHMYNLTALNERRVEMPVVFDFLWRQGSRLGIQGVNHWATLELGDGLEVGNVLGHYEVGGHTVVDRYEQPTLLQRVLHWPVLARDVLDITGEYDWIIAVSTLEHVRWDEGTPREPDGWLRAITHLRGLLRRDGQMLVTLPTGHNPFLDECLMEGVTGADRCCTYRRVDSTCDWELTDEIVVEPYGRRSQWADCVWIGEFSASVASTSSPQPSSPQPSSS